MEVDDDGGLPGLPFETIFLQLLDSVTGETVSEEMVMTPTEIPKDHVYHHGGIKGLKKV